MGFFLRGFEDDRSTTPCRSTRRSARCAVDLCGHVREIRRRHLDDRVDGGGCDTGRERPGMPAAESVGVRSEEQPYELQTPMRTSYAVYCLKKKKHNTIHT